VEASDAVLFPNKAAQSSRQDAWRLPRGRPAGRSTRHISARPSESLPTSHTSATVSQDTGSGIESVPSPETMPARPHTGGLPGQCACG
jgi:hypothetical protein